MALPSIERSLQCLIKKVEPTTTQTQAIITSHEHLRNNILQPLDFIYSTSLIGSYERNTLIRPIGDVDVFAILNSIYPAIAPKPFQILNKIKDQLKNKYVNSEIKQDRPCVTVNFNHCAFEITPVIKGGIYSYNGDVYNDYYLPDIKTNKWKAVADPKFLAQKLSAANQRLEGKLIPLIKIMKCWKKHKNIRWIKSYEMEEKAIEHFSNYSSIPNWRRGVIDLYCLYNNILPFKKWELQQLSDDEFAVKCKDWFGSDFVYL